MTKSRIGSDPLDSLISLEKETDIKPEKALKNLPKETPKEKAKKVRISVLLNEEVADRARDVVFWTPGETLASFCEKAIIDAISRTEKKRGEPFEKRTAEIRLGRPVR